MQLHHGGPPLQSSNLGSFQQNDLERREAAVRIVSLYSCIRTKDAEAQTSTPTRWRAAIHVLRMLPRHELKGPIFSLAPPFPSILPYSFGFTVTLARLSLSCDRHPTPLTSLSARYDPK